jgi:hypothetical protein
MEMTDEQLVRLRAHSNNIHRYRRLLKGNRVGAPEAETRSAMTAWIYVDTSKQVGDRDHLKVFANEDAAETWFQENDPEGVAFEYEE